MDTLHTVLRSIRGERMPRRDHLAVFREFLGHLDRIGARTKRVGTLHRANGHVRPQGKMTAPRAR